MAGFAIELRHTYLKCFFYNYLMELNTSHNTHHIHKEVHGGDIPFPLVNFLFDILISVKNVNIATNDKSIIMFWDSILHIFYGNKLSTSDFGT